MTYFPSGDRCGHQPSPGTFMVSLIVPRGAALKSTGPSSAEKAGRAADRNTAIKKNLLKIDMDIAAGGGLELADIFVGQRDRAGFFGSRVKIRETFIVGRNVKVYAGSRVRAPGFMAGRFTWPVV